MGKIIDGLLDDSATLQGCEVSDNLPSAFANTRLTARNNAARVGAILLHEITGDAQSGKQALHYFAAQLYDSPDQQNDIAEYLLLTGNAAHKTAPEHVGTYLRLKAEMLAKGTSGHSEFRSLLQSVLLGTSREACAHYVVADISDFYRDLLVGSTDISPNEQILAEADLPLSVEKAGNLLLAHFPLMRRVKLSCYDDIVASVELDGIMSTLDPIYQAQIRKQIEGEIDECVRTGADGGVPATEILLQAKLAVVVSKRVAAMMPYVSRKHWSDTDLESAVISAVSRMDVERPVDRRRSVEVAESLYYSYGFRDKQAYMHLGMRSQNKEQSQLRSDYELDQQIEMVFSASPRELRKAEELVLDKIFRSLDHRKVSTYDWKEYFTMHEGPFSVPARLMIAYESGMRIGTKYEGDGEKFSLVDVSINNFRLGHDRSIASTPLTFDLNDAESVLHAMLATYVNNRILAYMPASDTSWYSPVAFADSYSPTDRAIARELLNNYPVFSIIPPLKGDDISHGLALHLLQQLTNDTHLDETATLGQNLAVRQLHAMRYFTGAR